jgi:anti-sigma B factor antagonist
MKREEIPMSKIQRLKVEQKSGVTVVNFLDKRILDEPTIQAIAEQLFSLVDDSGKRELILNFSNVEYLSSAALGKLINLHKKLQGVQGRLAMCHVIPQIFEVFAITKLDKIFKIFPDEDAALEFFA